MKPKEGVITAQTSADERLLRALAEQLKLPLLRIARSAELAQLETDANLQHISQTADTALRLLDGFLLSSHLHGEVALQLEPVSIASLLTDTAHTLEPLARQHNCDITVSLGGKYNPVMAHRERLESAMLLLGCSLIEGRATEERRHEVVLGAHKSARGIVTGAFDNQPGLSADVFRRGRALYGSARQTMPTFSAGNGAGVFVADSLFRTMAADLRVARHDKLTGLAATLSPSSQLQLV